MFSQTTAAITSNCNRRKPISIISNHDNDIPTPAAKRLKCTQVTGDNFPHDGFNDQCQFYSCPRSPVNIGNDSNDSEQSKFPTTNLETGLPYLETDKNAIDEYENMRAEDELPRDLKSRLSKGKWSRGKASIYVDAFNLALETVLEDEGHLFDAKELQVFSHWRDLNYEAQYLKSSVWHRINFLNYQNEITALEDAFKSLQSRQTLPEASEMPEVELATLAPLEGLELGNNFTLADSSDEIITTIEEAASLLSLEELKAISKEAKIQGRNKTELLKALCKMSKNQSDLERFGLRKCDRDDQTLIKSTEITETDSRIYDATCVNHFFAKIMAILGPCIRLSLPCLKLFERVHLVFYRSSEWTQNSLTTIILAQITRQNYPSYIISRSDNIFSSRAELLEFEVALRIQFRVDQILEGSPNQCGFDEILAILDQVYPRWKTLLPSEQHTGRYLDKSGEKAYLNRFLPAWVYTRIIHKSTSVLGRLKDYGREHIIISDLLGQNIFHPARRGAWYQRKSLIEEHYMFEVYPLPSISDVELQKKYWKRVSLRTCETALQDKDCHQIFHYDLQKRVCKLEKYIKIPKREKHDFGHVLLCKPLEVCIEGIQVIREYRSRKSQISFEKNKHKSTKTIWINETEGGGECSVESMCLAFYRSRGYKGYHSEGGIIRTLFAYLFYDILFTYVPNVFQTAYQNCPLDLHTDAFFSSRATEINHRLTEIENGCAAAIIQTIDAKERHKRTCIIGLNWEFELADLLEIVNSFNWKALAVICRVLAQEYRIRRAGMPDLFLWCVEKNEVIFAEVKSTNDRLSETQRLWIHVLMGAGLRVELCHAVAKEIRKVDAE